MQLFWGVLPCPHTNSGPENNCLVILSEKIICLDVLTHEQFPGYFDPENICMVLLTQETISWLFWTTKLFWEQGIGEVGRASFMSGNAGWQKRN